MPSAKWNRGPLLIITAAVLILGLSAAASARTVLEPKLDQFVFFTDQSGSMYMTFDRTDRNKMSLVAEFLTKISKRIPELDYDGALVLFAPEKVLIRTGFLYNAKVFRKAVKRIDPDQKIFGRPTPMAPGLEWLDAKLPEGAPAKRLGIIVLSDGEANEGGDPVEAAIAILKKRPNVCFHVVSFADSPEGRKKLTQIHDLTYNCGIWANGPRLLEKDNLMKRFVADVFYREREVPDEPPRKPRPMQAPKPKPLPEKKEVIRLRGITFQFDKADIEPRWRPVLNEAAGILRAQENQSVNILIEGHADAVGTEEYNQVLSERRARSVYDYLIEKGVDPKQLKITGKSEREPIASNETEQGRAINRRIEFEVAQ